MRVFTVSGKRNHSQLFFQILKIFHVNRLLCYGMSSGMVFELSSVSQEVHIV